MINTITKYSTPLNSRILRSLPNGNDIFYGNISLVVHGHSLIGSIRRFGYKIVDKFKYQNVEHSNGLLIVQFDRQFNITRCYETKICSYVGNVDTSRIEDMRLFERCGSIWFSATLIDIPFVGTGKKRHASIIVGTISITGMTALLTVLYLSDNDRNVDKTRWQKNWMFIPGYGLRFIQDMGRNSMTIIDIDSETVTTRQIPNLCYDYRGNTPLIHCGNSYMCMVHRVLTPKTYINRLLMFDNNMNLINTSNEFKLTQSHIEFTTSMIASKQRIFSIVTAMDRDNFLVCAPMYDFFKNVGLTS